MTRPYTATELSDPALHEPEWTDRHGQYVFANSSTWPSAMAVKSELHITNSCWQVRWVAVQLRPPWRLLAVLLRVSAQPSCTVLTLAQADLYTVGTGYQLSGIASAASACYDHVSSIAGYTILSKGHAKLSG